MDTFCVLTGVIFHIPRNPYIWNCLRGRKIDRR